MNGLKLAQARDYFARGLVAGFSVRRAGEVVPMYTGPAGWCLLLKLRGEDQLYVLHTATGKEKVFRRLDTIVDEIGGIAACLVHGFGLNLVS